MPPPPEAAPTDPWSLGVQVEEGLEQTPFGDFVVMKVTIADYVTTAKSRRRAQALGMALRDLGERIAADSLATVR